jgi:zinc protease
MIHCRAWGLAALLTLAVPIRPAETNVFPFPYKIDRLENGLKIVSVPLTNQTVLSFTTIVRAGSRDEVEAGASGFAHFFEHMMSRGTRRISQTAAVELLARLGAATSSLTTDDFTRYDTVFSGRENLEKVIRIEADRFINISHTADMIRAEAPVLENEFRAGSADPGRRLIELLRDTAFTAHAYKHTTLGRLKDIQERPGQSEYDGLFQKRFYSPDNTVLLVIGDFDPARLRALIKQYYGGWEKSNYTPAASIEPPQPEARRIHEPWPAETLPRLAIGFHGPAYSDETIDKAALNLAAEIAFSPFSPLFRRLVADERTCLSLSASFGDTRDPSLLIISAVARSAADLPVAEGEILKELERLKTDLVAPSVLADVRSHLRHSVSAALETVDGIAGVLVPSIGLTGDPGTLNALFDLYEKITPSDIRDMARRYFRPAGATTVTLAAGGGK